MDPGEKQCRDDAIDRVYGDINRAIVLIEQSKADKARALLIEAIKRDPIPKVP